MNISLQDVKGSVLVISQFTLCGDWRKGRRPSFTKAADTDKGKLLYNGFIDAVRNRGINVETGEFGADMDVSLVNNGPVTFVLDSHDR
jgi:D-tyrosyl-tRNA(Tyr) deacylase